MSSHTATRNLFAHSPRTTPGTLRLGGDRSLSHTPRTTAALCFCCDRFPRAARVTAWTTSCCGASDCHAFLTSDDGADTPAEGDCAFYLEPFWVELTDADVLVGNMHLSVLETVRLCPRLCLAWIPSGVATEEKRLDVH